MSQWSICLLGGLYVNLLFNLFSEMTISHQGTDAAVFDYVKVQSVSGKFYQCDFEHIFIDNEDHLSSNSCFAE